jgi:hypothetical protein
MPNDSKMWQGYINGLDGVVACAWTFDITTIDSSLFFFDICPHNGWCDGNLCNTYRQGKVDKKIVHPNPI